MNIVVIGSCTDSSILARELNKRLHNSIVARVDMLKNIKNLLLQGSGVNTAENLGAYVGDVETYDLSKLTEAQRTQFTEAYNYLTKKKTTLGKSSNFTSSTFDALTNSLPSGTYSFIKVYSGLINDSYPETLAYYNSLSSGSIFIVVNSPKNSLLPVSISDGTKDMIKRNAFAFIECNTVEDVFSTEVFQVLFDLNNEKNKVEKKKEVKPATTVTMTMEDDFEVVMADAA